MSQLNGFSQAGSSFCSMHIASKIIIFKSAPSIQLDYVTYFVFPIYTPRKGTARENCLVRKLNTISLIRAQVQALQFSLECYELTIN